MCLLEPPYPKLSSYAFVYNSLLYIIFAEKYQCSQRSVNKIEETGPWTSPHDGLPDPLMKNKPQKWITTTRVQLPSLTCMRTGIPKEWQKKQNKAKHVREQKRQ